ncbi:hypothetical protein SODALDRAFT_330567 [Sodiomyces alkalinus F11]|uniref:Rhomboid family membrane protein n=1 Tax=Sodiomyces alkalinus (strain CBS 110278 / VKM F-3762 / F11) TaxID=1314773 RepID=A0A3N2Q2D8_SODAK|nr:hypothetical protein SODALDRAFT_330567 [Sodiomyces alkalinus F11]ROT40838.1 hypothetical protein SODALDRAFT_330567 [Sodiomyces alkalinus F11]
MTDQETPSLAPGQTQPSKTPQQTTPPLVHKAAIAGAIISPLVMLLPPRRMDWRFLILAATFSMSTSQLAYDYTGRSIYDRVGDRAQQIFNSDLPEHAKEAQRRLRQERMAREGLMEADMRRIELEKRGRLEKLWYGDETQEEWNRRRAEDHKKALEEGKGLWGIIVDQVVEVMPGGGNPEEPGQEKPAKNKEEDKKDNKRP